MNRHRWPLGERVYWSLMLVLTAPVGGFFAYAVAVALGGWS